MKTIKSFCVDHDVLKKGMYISRIDGDVVTYDLRMVVPNQGPYLENAGLHTFEHLLATYVRNSSWSDAMVYVRSDGLPHRVLSAETRDTMSHAEALRLVQEAMAFIGA